MEMQFTLFKYIKYFYAVTLVPIDVVELFQGV